MAAPIIGRNLSLGYAKEITRNTAVATPAKFIPYTEMNLQPKKEYFEDNTGFGRPEMMAGRLSNQEYVAGSIGGYVDADTIGELLFHLFGQETPVTALGATTHTFNRLNSTEFPTFSLFYTKAPARSLVAKGCNIDKFSIEFGEKETKWSADIIGISEAVTGAITPAYAQRLRYLLFRHLTVKSATTVAGLSAGTSQQIKNLKLTFSNNSKIDFSTGTGTDSLNPFDINQTTWGCEVSFDQTVRDTNLITAYNANTLTAFQFDCENLGAAVLGTSLLKPKLSFILAPSIVEIDDKAPLDDVEVISVKIKGQYSISDSFLVRAILQNLVAAY